VAPGGYVWWYIDAISDDGRQGLTIIAFVGSVFSPYYAWSGWADPNHHCAVNVALYGMGKNHWAMTERGRKALHREADVLSIGRSSLVWRDGALTLTFDEVTAPVPSRLRGTVRLHPSTLLGQDYALDADARHIWRPIAPRSRVEVSLDNPAGAWRGNGYFDTNAGDEPLDRAFSAWDWSRAHRPRDTLLFYDVTRRGGESANLALRIGAGGEIEPVEAPPRRPLPSTLWRMPRIVRGDAGETLKVRRTLEDTPFYTRSILDGAYAGEPAEIMHESLSLNRLRSPIVRAMLPFRMPRVFW
jgi:carotenoid 1,2-hydratase